MCLVILLAISYTFSPKEIQLLAEVLNYDGFPKFDNLK